MPRGSSCFIQWDREFFHLEAEDESDESYGLISEYPDVKEVVDEPLAQGGTVIKRLGFTPDNDSLNFWKEIEE